MLKIIAINNEKTAIMPNPQNLKNWEKGQSGNPNGRPRKYVCTLKKQGYKQSEINDCIKVMISMNLEELREVWENPDSTVLEKTIASALRKSIQKGDLIAVDSLMNRVYGKPTETVENNVKMRIKKTQIEIVRTESNTLATDESKVDID